MVNWRILFTSHLRVNVRAAGRRRDKINHWIMKLGSIIPADGSIVEIGDSGRVSIANVEGQSKGGILSKACEYVQMLQEKRA